MECNKKRLGNRMGMELSLVLIKPDAVELSLTGEILSHLDLQDLFLVGAKVVKPTYQLAADHYLEHKGKPFYEDLINYIMGKYHRMSGIYAFLYYGKDACSRIRALAGNTNPMNKGEGRKIITIRQKYGKNVIIFDENNNEVMENGHVLVRYENVMHASYYDKAEYEVKLWFSPEEIIEEYRLYSVKTVPDVFQDGRVSRRLVWEKDVPSLRKELFGS